MWNTKITIKITFNFKIHKFIENFLIASIAAKIHNNLINLIDIIIIIHKLLGILNPFSNPSQIRYF